MASVTHNGGVLARDAIGTLSFDSLRERLRTLRAEGGHVAAVTVEDPVDPRALLFLLAHDTRSELEVLRVVVHHTSYASLTLEFPELHLFERALAERFSLLPTGHPGMHPVRFVADAGKLRPLPGVQPFCELDGEACHSVAVGPVHAGVIEPGHFRFDCHGEHVFHLEIALGYQHRDALSFLIGGPYPRSLLVAETLAGDSSIAHALAYCQLLEGLSSVRPSPRAHAIRALALELERMANHTGTLGALAGDVAFAPSASACGALRGDLLNLMATLCGNRFGRSLVRPGGVAFDLEAERIADMMHRLERTMQQVQEALHVLLSSPSVQSRFELVGRLDRAAVEPLGLVGVSARACGIERDVRHDHPFGHYRVAQIARCSWPTGDVYARALVRHLELQRSYELCRRILENMPRGVLRKPLAALAPNSVAVSLVEGHRGEVCHLAVTDVDGRFQNYDVVDASFHNWTALSLALVDQQISDFPLCNKSFDLSYCGFDL